MIFWQDGTSTKTILAPILSLIRNHNPTRKHSPNRKNRRPPGPDQQQHRQPPYPPKPTLINLRRVSSYQTLRACRLNSEAAKSQTLAHTPHTPAAKPVSAAGRSLWTASRTVQVTVAVAPFPDLPWTTRGLDKAGL
jgi:hypothetical protein